MDRPEPPLADLISAARDAAGDRLARQLALLVEVDRLKGVLRRTLLVDRSRRENSAEHSWHIALAAVLLAEHAAERVDVARVVNMLLVHDLVEIDAGDTYVYDAEATLDKAAREERAAERLFGLLPSDQAAEVRALWDEFERRDTPEARFAAAVDRMQPIVHNVLTDGHTWRQHGVARAQVEAVNRHIADGAPALWETVRRLLDRAVEKGHLGR
ncbi:MAG TPA: HD domain-containing protein [Thermoanaerobaculia bacterium]|nr:HD domain-containing protein [Thermoanaerobaculia bacterium]